MDRNIKIKKAWYKRAWVWVGIIVVLIIIGSAMAPKGQQSTTTDQSQQTPKQEGSTKWDFEAAFGKIQNGMSKAEVEEVTGKKSESCSITEDPTFGKTEFCSYGNAFIDKASIMVTYRQDKVEMKTKNTY